MSKRKRSKTPAPAATVPLVGSTDHYRYFLNNNIPKKAPTKLGAAAVGRWPNVTAGVRGQIENEIAQKFNRHNILGGIRKVKYGPVGAGYGYFTDKEGLPQLNLAPMPGGKMTDGANSTRVVHELTHANDHQVDNLNDKVWGHLGVLANTGNGGTSMRDFTQFQQSLARIQDKIDPLKDFSLAYNKDYNPTQLQFDIGDATSNPGYSIPNIPGTANPDWPQLFNQIRAVTTAHPLSVGQPPNSNYKLPHASEFPAYLGERLEHPLNAGDRRGGAGTALGPNALSLPEARFIHSTLGDMATAYPATDYPTMNYHIAQRRNSLENAYYPGTPATATAPAVPPGVPAGSTFSHGGPVTGKNLLSRFKKHTRH